MLHQCNGFLRKFVKVLQTHNFYAYNRDVLVNIFKYLLVKNHVLKRYAPGKSWIKINFKASFLFGTNLLEIFWEKNDFKEFQVRNPPTISQISFR